MTGLQRILVNNAKNPKYIHCWSNPNEWNIKDESFKLIWSILDREVKLLGGDSSKVFLCGHSQGSDLAVSSGLMYGKKLGGICGLQGGVWNIRWRQTIENAETPVMMLMGSKDDIVNNDDVKKYMISQKMFKRKNFSWVVMPIDHNNTPEQFEKVKNMMGI